MSQVWIPRNLRARLAMWHVAAMVLVLMVYATAVFALVRHNASQALDDRLRGDFLWAARWPSKGRTARSRGSTATNGKKAARGSRSGVKMAGHCFVQPSRSGYPCQKTKPWHVIPMVGSHRCRPVWPPSGS